VLPRLRWLIPGSLAWLGADIAASAGPPIVAFDPATRDPAAAGVDSPVDSVADEIRRIRGDVGACPLRGTLLHDGLQEQSRDSLFTEALHQVIARESDTDPGPARQQGPSVARPPAFPAGSTGSAQPAELASLLESAISRLDQLAHQLETCPRQHAADRLRAIAEELRAARARVGAATPDN
jgi:hypothetical protein